MVLLLAPALWACLALGTLLSRTLAAGAHIAPLHCTAGSLHSTFTRRPAAKARLSRSDGSVRLHAFPPFERCSDSTIVDLRRRSERSRARSAATRLSQQHQYPDQYQHQYQFVATVSCRFKSLRVVSVGCGWLQRPWLSCPSRAANALLVMTHTLDKYVC